MKLIKIRGRGVLVLNVSLCVCVCVCVCVFGCRGLPIIFTLCCYLPLPQVICLLPVLVVCKLSF